MTETAWMYCRECDKFDDGEHSERPCSGKAFDYEIKDGKPPCKNYNWKGQKMAVVDKIIEYENGEMTTEDTVEFFSELVKSGMAWTLQGHYGRTASALIDNGVLNVAGDIDYDRLAEVLE